MHNGSLRKRVVTGSLTLPVTAIAVLLLRLAPSPLDRSVWAATLLAFATAFLLSEWNTRFTLLRVRSRMVSTLFLAFTAALPFLHASASETAVAACFALSYLFLSGSYQQARAEGHVFNAFFLLSAGSFFCPYLAVCCFFYYLSMLFQLRSFTWRTFSAGLLGFFAPLWLVAGAAVAGGRTATLLAYLRHVVTFSAPDYSGITLPRLISLGAVFLCALIAVFHFFRTAYNDKIRTRMLFYVILTQEFVLAAGFVVLPSHFDALLLLFTLNSAPLIAHHLALGKGRAADVWFYVVLLLAVGTAVMNYAVAFGRFDAFAAMRPLAGFNLAGLFTGLPL